MSKAYISSQDPQTLIVEYDHVSKQLALTDGWQQGFGLSTSTKLSSDGLDELDVKSLGELLADYQQPTSGVVVGKNAIALRFDKEIDPSSRLSFAASRNAQYGVHRRWQLEFGGVSDESGHQAPAFTLLPIGEPSADTEPKPLDKLKPSGKTPSANAQWKQIAINCIGRFPEGIIQPDAEAGVQKWRQKYWNPVSSGMTPNTVGDEDAHFRTVIPAFR